MKIAAFGVAATAGVANAGLALYPVHLQPSNVCSKAPYKQFLPISVLPAAQSYCHKEFPVTTPVCYHTTTIVSNSFTRKTHTVTLTQPRTTTVYTGPGTTHTVVLTLTPSNIVHTITSTLPATITVCPTRGATTSATSVTKASSSSSSSSPKKRSLDVVEEAEIEAREAQVAEEKAPTGYYPAMTTSTKLSPKDLSSRRALLRTIEAKGKGAVAHTVCDCIMTNPSCTYAKATKTAYSTSIKTIMTQTTVDVHPVKTIFLPNKQTYFHTNTQLASRKVVTTTVPVVPEGGQHTISVCSYSNSTITSTKA